MIHATNFNVLTVYGFVVLCTYGYFVLVNYIKNVYIFYHTHCLALSWDILHHIPWNVLYQYRRCDCLLQRLFRRRSKKTSKLRVTGVCEGNSPATGEFPAQRASNAEHVSIWLRHHVAITSMDWKFVDDSYICWAMSVFGLTCHHDVQHRAHYDAIVMQASQLTELLRPEAMLKILYIEFDIEYS